MSVEDRRPTEPPHAKTNHLQLVYHVCLNVHDCGGKASQSPMLEQTTLNLCTIYSMLKLPTEQPHA